MLAFGAAIDRLGRRTGVVWATIFLVLGIAFGDCLSWLHYHRVRRAVRHRQPGLSFTVV